jgi:hypothetical protein
MDTSLREEPDVGGADPDVGGVRHNRSWHAGCTYRTASEAAVSRCIEKGRQCRIDAEA